MATEKELGQEWIARLEGLSDEPLRRAAQIALAAIDCAISRDGGDIEMYAAYETLQAALA